MPTNRAGSLTSHRSDDEAPPVLAVEHMDHLIAAVQAADVAARDELIRRCTPMVRFRATRERERRRAWGSAIPLDDLVQDGMVGLLKGASSYQPGRTHRDPLAYLATWVVQEMRRRADKADHDWDISTEMAEKFRRIHAIRSRLFDALGRAPTTAEILAAADDPLYSRVGPFVERHRHTDNREAGDRVRRSRWTKLSAKDIDLEARYRDRLRHGRRLGACTDDDDIDDLVRPLDRSLGASDDFAWVDNHAAANTLREIVDACLRRLDPPEQVRVIIERVHGLRGHRKTTQREVARILGMSRDLVADAVSWFADAMAQPGGVFYRAVAALGPVDRETLGLSWVETALADAASAPPAIPPRLIHARLRLIGEETRPDAEAS